MGCSAIAWVLSVPLISVCISGARNAIQIADSFDVLDVVITPDARAS